MTAPAADKITVANNKKATEDTIEVTGLKADDKVNLYSAATGGTAIGTATVADGKTSVTVKVKLGAKAGKVYVTVTKGEKEESTCVAKKYIAK
ncbi:hypothetical protein [Bacillus cereus]